MFGPSRLSGYTRLSSEAFPSSEQSSAVFVPESQIPGVSPDRRQRRRVDSEPLGLALDDPALVEELLQLGLPTSSGSSHSSGRQGHQLPIRSRVPESPVATRSVDRRRQQQQSAEPSSSLLLLPDDLLLHTTLPEGLELSLSLEQELAVACTFDTPQRQILLASHDDQKQQAPPRPTSPVQTPQPLASEVLATQTMSLEHGFGLSADEFLIGMQLPPHPENHSFGGGGLDDYGVLELYPELQEPIFEDLSSSSAASATESHQQGPVADPLERMFQSLTAEGFRQRLEHMRSLAPGAGSRLSDWGLPDSVEQAYVRTYGVERLYDWQSECLRSPGVCGGRNLLYVAPTSGGKTLVSEVLLLRQLLAWRQLAREARDIPGFPKFGLPRKTALVVLPYVSMVEEKTEALRKLFRRITSVDRSIKLTVQPVHSQTQPSKSRETFPRKDVVVCTMEKASSILSSLLAQFREQYRASPQSHMAPPDCLRLCVVVLDEVHLISDPQRGFQLELLVSLIKQLDAMKAGEPPGGLPDAAAEIFPTPATAAAVSSSQQPSNTPVTTFAGLVTPLLPGVAAQPDRAQTLLRAQPPVQIVAMTATLANAPEVADWMGAACYECVRRPVQLQEFIKHGQEIFDRELVLEQPVRRMPPLVAPGQRQTPPRPPPRQQRQQQQKQQQQQGPVWDVDDIGQLCFEATGDGDGVLVFCRYRNETEQTALRLAKILPALHQHQQSQPDFPQKLKQLRSSASSDPNSRSSSDRVALKRRRTQLDPEKHGPQRLELVRQLAELSVELDPNWRQSLLSGVAWHNAALTVEERGLIEQAFRDGVISVLCATSTLAVGVNLPVRRVIFPRSQFGQKFLQPLDYRQMSGRAGRAGFHASGECFLLMSSWAKDPVLNQTRDLLHAPMPEAISCLGPVNLSPTEAESPMEPSPLLCRAVLEVFCAGLVWTKEDCVRYVLRTLFAHQVLQRLGPEAGQRFVRRCVGKALEMLRQEEILLQYRLLQDPSDENAGSLQPINQLDEDEASPRQRQLQQQELRILQPSKLGRAAYFSSMSLDEASFVQHELDRGSASLVISSMMHMCYLLAPLETDVTPDWERLFEIHCAKGHGQLRQLVERIGITQAHLLQFKLRAPAYMSTRELLRKYRLLQQQQRVLVVKYNREVRVWLQLRAAQHQRQQQASTIRLESQPAADELGAEPEMPPAPRLQQLRALDEVRVQLRCHRLWVAMIAEDLLSGNLGLPELARKYRTERGFLQRLQESLGGFAHRVSRFSAELNYRSLELQARNCADSLTMGVVQGELLDFMKSLPRSLTAGLARELTKAGFPDAVAVARASHKTIFEALEHLLPFTSLRDVLSKPGSAEDSAGNNRNGNHPSEMEAGDEGEAKRRFELGRATFRVWRDARKLLGLSTDPNSVSADSDSMDCIQWQQEDQDSPGQQTQRIVRRSLSLLQAINNRAPTAALGGVPMYGTVTVPPIGLLQGGSEAGSAQQQKDHHHQQQQQSSRRRSRSPDSIIQGRHTLKGSVLHSPSEADGATEPDAVDQQPAKPEAEKPQKLQDPEPRQRPQQTPSVTLIDVTQTAELWDEFLDLTSQLDTGAWCMGFSVWGAEGCCTDLLDPRLDSGVRRRFERGCRFCSERPPGATAAVGDRHCLGFAVTLSPAERQSSSSPTAGGRAAGLVAVALEQLCFLLPLRRPPEPDRREEKDDNAMEDADEDCDDEADDADVGKRDSRRPFQAVASQQDADVDVEGAVDADEVWHWLQSVFDNPQVRKLAYNLQAHLRLLSALGVSVRAPVEDGLDDPAVAHWLLNPNDPGDLEAKSFLNHYDWQFRPDIVELGLVQPYLGGTVLAELDGSEHRLCARPLDSDARANPAALHCAMFVVRLSRLAARLRTMLGTQGLLPVYRTLEMPVVPVLAQMEVAGVGYAPAKAAEILTELQFREQWLRALCWCAAGFPWNLRSWIATANVLFVYMRLKPPRGALRGKGSRHGARYRCNGRILRALQETYPEQPLPVLIQELRRVEQALQLCRSVLARCQTDIAAGHGLGRVHARLLQTGSATGRILAMQPDWQTVPRMPLNLPRVPRYSLHEELQQGAVQPVPGNPSLQQADADQKDHSLAGPKGLLLRSLAEQLGLECQPLQVCGPGLERVSRLLGPTPPDLLKPVAVVAAEDDEDADRDDQEGKPSLGKRRRVESMDNDSSDAEDSDLQSEDEDEDDDQAREEDKEAADSESFEARMDEECGEFDVLVANAQLGGVCARGRLLGMRPGHFVGDPMPTSKGRPAPQASLARYWEIRGHPTYSKQALNSVAQVWVRLEGGRGMVLTYPADKVWRSRAFLPLLTGRNDGVLRDYLEEHKQQHQQRLQSVSQGADSGLVLDPDAASLLEQLRSEELDELLSSADWDSSACLSSSTLSAESTGSESEPCSAPSSGQPAPTCATGSSSSAAEVVVVPPLSATFLSQSDPVLDWLGHLTLPRTTSPSPAAAPQEEPSCKRLRRVPATPLRPPPPHCPATPLRESGSPWSSQQQLHRVSQQLLDSLYLSKATPVQVVRERLFHQEVVPATPEAALREQLSPIQRSYPWPQRSSTVDTAAAAAAAASQAAPDGASASPAKEDRNSEFSLRECFVARPGCSLLSLDYSQIELRLVAHFSHERELCRQLKQDADVMRELAAKIFEVAPNAVSAEQRQAAKTFFYARLYGGSGEGSLPSELLQQSRSLLQRSYPELQSWRNAQLRLARREGYVGSLKGRRRPIPECNNSATLGRSDMDTAKVRAQAERQVINTRCQSSTADVIKLAMKSVLQVLTLSNQVWTSLQQQQQQQQRWQPKTDLVDLFRARLELEFKKHRGAQVSPAVEPDPAAQIVLQLHDELIIEVRTELLDVLRPLIQQTMEKVADWSCCPRLTVRCKVGPSWGSLQPLPEGVSATTLPALSRHRGGTPLKQAQLQVSASQRAAASAAGPPPAWHQRHRRGRDANTMVQKRLFNA